MKAALRAGMEHGQAEARQQQEGAESKKAHALAETAELAMAKTALASEVQKHSRAKHYAQLLKRATTSYLLDAEESIMLEKGRYSDLGRHVARRTAHELRDETYNRHSVVSLATPLGTFEDDPSHLRDEQKARRTTHHPHPTHPSHRQTRGLRCPS